MTDPRQQFEDMVATQPDIQCKGAKSRYTAMNGNMFAFVTPDGLIALRLGDTEREAFMKKHGTGPVIQHGATMRGYVEVPPALAKKKAQLAKHFAMSVEYARTLPAKPTTKAGQKKAAKK
ncbi:MAG: hypothetical protein NXI31_13510 [bacterium]|nr:hypothetical protein [bacterium]